MIVALHPKLGTYVEGMLQAFDSIPAERKEQLETIAGFVRSKIRANERALLTFICTHNSRRSHLGQLWAATAAAHYGVEGVKTFSGGTEATAFDPRAVAAIERAGFQVDKPEGDNPHYEVTFAADAPAQECFSKRYDDPFNPKDGFVAIMTCSQADQSCPLVRGAALRVPLPYEDPKAADGTPEEAEAYDERTRQIGTEMFYLFSRARA